MSDNVVIFNRPTWNDEDRLEVFGSCEVDATKLAAYLGTPEQWRHSAILHLKAASTCPAPDGVIVSQAALHLVLTYLERLEISAGIDCTEEAI